MSEINTNLYKITLQFRSNSVLSGKIEKDITIGDKYMCWDTPLIKAFLADDDIQEITFCSTNIGFVKTLTKMYKQVQQNE